MVKSKKPAPHKPPPSPEPPRRRRGQRKVDEGGQVIISLRIKPELIEKFDRMAASSATGETVSDLVRKAMLYYHQARLRPPQTDW
jgi:hypothetical protein